MSYAESKPKSSFLSRGLTTADGLRELGHQPEPMSHAIRRKCFDCSGGSRGPRLFGPRLCPVSVPNGQESMESTA